jgi:nickel/cobalt transporter (NicO) family protein
MTDIAALIAGGAGNAWVFMPSAILLGALHGLEPGHSKTMMAAFIIAVRGTLSQAVLLGLAATLSHTAVVWAIALIGLHFGAQWNSETSEPYFQLVSGLLIIGIALWMLWRTWREQHHHDHHHRHHDEIHGFDTALGRLTLELFEDGVPPRWRVRLEAGQQPGVERISLETRREVGVGQVFAFAARDGYLESVDEIPEPHAFTARLSLRHGEATELYEIAFQEHDHDAEAAAFQDAHERAHARDIERRFADRDVTTAQMVLFGLTGGLIPCPASITILLLCLQLKQFTLGAVLVLCFSIGLAITMVSVGAAAALSVHHVSRRWSGFTEFARRAPYVSSALIICVGLYTGALGLSEILAHGS